MRFLILLLVCSLCRAAEPHYFAQIDNDGTVLQVIVATQDVIDARPGVWKETYIDAGGDPTKAKNYAGIGYQYRDDLNAFVTPKPSFDSWTLDAQTAQYKAPKPEPTDRPTAWDEQKKEWIDVVPVAIDPK